VTTLANIRAQLNSDLGMTTDADAKPYTQAQRNAAISLGYGALWWAGVWKNATDSIATVDNAQSYLTTTVKKLYDVALVDSTGYIVGYPKAKIDDTAAGATLFLVLPVSSGYTLSVHGWAPYISTFANDSASDDLDPSLLRIPLLKARSILYSGMINQFMAFSGHQSSPAALNVTLEQLLTAKATAEREWENETRNIAVSRDRISQPAFSRPR
jgi:hypothetical protein